MEKIGVMKMGMREVGGVMRGKSGAEGTGREGGTTG